MKWLTNIDEGGDQLPEPRQGEGHEADEVGGGDDSRTHAHAHARHTHAHRTQLHAHHATLIWLWPVCKKRNPEVKKIVNAVSRKIYLMAPNP